MGECIAVVSGKGGTGKTSFVAGVGSALSEKGKRVLCIDCDVGLRNLDLALGLTDRAMMDFSDVAQGRCDLKSAVVHSSQFSSLDLLTAPANSHGQPVETEAFRAFLEQARQEYDYCFLDAPAGLGSGFRLAVCGADRCIVVATSDAASLRDAQHTVMELSSFPERKVLLAVNRVQKRMLRDMGLTIDDAIDATGAPLIGLIPEDRALPLALNQGVPILVTKNRLSSRAYQNIARRLTGETVPLSIRN